MSRTKKVSRNTKHCDENNSEIELGEPERLNLCEKRKLFS